MSDPHLKREYGVYRNATFRIGSIRMVALNFKFFPADRIHLDAKELRKIAKFLVEKTANARRS